MFRWVVVFGVSLGLLVGCGGRSVDPGGDAGETAKKTPGKDQTVPVKPPPPPPPPPPPEVREPVTCVFSGSTAPQKCYSGNFSCEGTTSCTVQVTAAPGTQLTWKSTCGGYAYTTVDGNDETAKFFCGPPKDVELVTCLFKGSSAVQECYSATSGSTGYGCKGVTSCTVKVQAKPGTKITWKSSCGGYVYTTVDGLDENAEFYCAP